jgi:4-azaleucine resistance transporter AzlC
MINDNSIENPNRRPLSFTFGGLVEGASLSAGIAISVFTYGLVFGVLSQQVGLSLLESLLMSLLVFAGSSQFAVMGLWVYPLPIFNIVLTTLVINLRHLLMGASISPWFSRLKPWQRYLSLHFLSDESWALTMGQYAKKKGDGAFMLGCGLVLLAAWTGSTVTGRWLGSIIQDPAKWGLDFAFAAVFIALLVGMWKGKSSIIPWLVAGVVGGVASLLLPGKWYILLGGLAGSLVGAWQDGD